MKYDQLKMFIAVQPNLAFWALHPLMLYLLSIVHSHLLYIQSTKILDGYQEVDSSDELQEMFQEY
jgi:hypothetical protein